MDRQLEILITNDDSYISKGFNTLVALCSAIGNVTAVAPKTAQSGMSAALSMGKPLFLNKEDERTTASGNKIKIYSFTGTPADCVKIAMNKFFSRENKPDLMFSGINHGSNASTAAVYSGTLGATAEAAIYEVPAIALSVNTHDPDADFSAVKKWFRPIVENYLANPPQKGVYLNINFPDIPLEQIQGIKFAHQGDGMWIEEFEDYKTPHGEPFYWICGKFLDKAVDHEGDHTLIDDGYITIVPHLVDSTSYKEMYRLQKLWKF
ncbi:MAG: 5'/3'-nucleotidase SurE [Bacteroidales bacterium]|nr:5'/3'-nucleotidase SurE [Bacteroidales bacterium]